MVATDAFAAIGADLVHRAEAAIAASAEAR
jgi:hypothetical protein